MKIVLYTSYLHIIGGIETFVLNFLDLLGNDYEIVVICPKIPEEMAARIREKATLITAMEMTTCDTLIMVRMNDPIPFYITYSKSIRMCHACKINPSWEIRPDCDTIVHVSEASKETFGTNGEVILNSLTKTKKKALLFVSATRIPAMDKGKNAERMLNLARMLNNSKIPFLWLNFSDKPLNGAPKGFMNVGCYQDLQPYIAKADYLVQLSDHEGFGYSVLEALMNNTAVICTPFETTSEMGVVDGKNGYIVPYDMTFDVKKLLNVPVFEYSWDNEAIRRKWKKLIGNAKPKKKAAPQKMVMVKAVKGYKDLLFDRRVERGEVIEVTKERALALINAGLGEMA